MNANDEMSNLNSQILYVNTGFHLEDLKNALLSDNYRESTEVQELFESISSICNDRDQRFITCLPSGTKIYRARTVTEIGDAEIQKAGISIDRTTNGFNENNSKEAPFGKAPAGRNNISGISYFYGASDPETACSELKEYTRATISVAEFELLRDVLLIDMKKVKTFSQAEIDLAGKALGKYWSGIMFQFSIPVKTDKEYRLTQIISEEFRKQGCDGLCYSSFYGHGLNYTVFSCGSNVLAYKNSRLVQLMYNNQVFWDYNNKCVLESFPDPHMYQFNDHVAQKQLDSIKRSWAVSTATEKKDVTND